MRTIARNALRRRSVAVHARAVAVLGAVSLSLAAQDPAHAVATINDPRSHGQLGDNFLSLNEAIQLHNRTLTPNQMSATEQLQISFIGGDIALADIDSTLVQTVTLERDLDPILNLPHGLNLRASPFTATIDIANTNGFIVDSDFCDFRRITIRGGRYAVRIAQRDTFYGSTFEQVRFEGQSISAVQVYLAQNDGETFLRFENCTFTGIPTAVRIDDLGTNRRGEVSMRGCLFDGGSEGFVLNLGPGGNSYNLRLDRSTFQNQTAGGLLVKRAAAANDRGVVLDLFDMVTRNVPVGVAVDGHATALTDALVRMVDLQGTTALRLGGAGTNTKIAVQDSTFQGRVDFGGKTTINLDNVRHAGGTLTLEAAASTTVAIGLSAFANVTTDVRGASACTFDTCRFDNGSVTATASAPTTIRNSYVGGTTLGANTTNVAPIGNQPLGSTRVSVQQIAVGQPFTLSHDLPPGYLGVWLFGLGNDLPPTTVSGMRVYIEMATLAIYPGTFRGQGTAPFVVPAISALRGLNLMFQMLVGHDIGIRGPLMQMPPGGRVLLH